MGYLSTAAGWQAAIATMSLLRAITHALRGWPTPPGIAINTIPESEDPIDNEPVRAQLMMMIDQKFDFLG